MIPQDIYDAGTIELSADRAVLTVVYRTRGDGALLGAPGKQIALEVPAVTILKVEDGEVVHHLDHVDYATLMAQVEAQRDPKP